MSLVLDGTVDLEKLISEAETLVDRRNPEALPLAEHAMTLALKSGNSHHIAYAKYIVAFYSCLVANDYDKAIRLCKECLSDLSDEDTGDVSYKIYMTLGNSYQLSGDVFAAQESYMFGLKQLEARNVLNTREKGFLASFYYNVSLLLSTSELNMPTEEYLIKAIEIYKEIDNGFKLSKSYVAYSGIFESRGESQKAIDILFKALEIDERINDLYSMALTKANLGIQHLGIAKLDSANNYLADALEYFVANNMVWETAMVRIPLGETLIAAGKKDEGIEQLLQAEILFNSLDNKRELSHVYQLLGTSYSEKNDYKTAFYYQGKHVESLKFFFNTEKTNALTRAKKEFETEQKEKETLLLKEKNEEIKRYVHKLEGSNNELKQFAHVASHDLREPLRMVNSYMGLVKKSLNGKLSEQENEFISFALDGAKRMDQLIVDLLRLAKIDSNPQISMVKMRGIVDEIRLNLQALLQDKNAVIISNDLPEIMADRTQILQLFQNLIGNGIKYNESKNPEVKVKFVRKVGALEISISDNGIGIPEHCRDKVFNIFQRLHTVKEYTGSGIGLAICKKIVESLEGKIFVEDNPTGGTVFRMVFPASLMVNNQVPSLPGT